MEFVGKIVKKPFEGFGLFSGVIESYDPSSGFFKVSYDDGDFEELEFDEVSSILQIEQEHGMGVQIQRPRRRRKPKKRRMMEETQLITGEFTETHANSCVGDFADTHSGEANSVDTQMEKSGFADSQMVENGFSGTQKKRHGFEDTQLEESGFVETQQEESGFGDAQMEGGGFMETKDTQLEENGFVETQLEENGFDDPQMEGGGFMETEQATSGFADTQMEESGFMKNPAEKSFFTDTHMEKNGFGGSESGASIDQVADSVKTHGFAQMQMEKGVFLAGSLGSHVKNGVSNGVLVQAQMEACDFVESQMKESPFPAPKRRKTCDGNSNSLLPTPPRRSSRLTGTSSVSVPVPKKLELEDAIAEPFKNQDGPQIVSLPPSSKDLQSDDLPVLDLFSVYSCLRSFSTSLFLSPFGLEDFVAALKNETANSLLDSIHFSLLQALKRHLKFLSAEGSNSASTCLRSLDWNLLDLITWPVYLVDYALICGVGKKSSIVLDCKKLLNGGYWKQSPTVKLEIIQCLCDDAMEAEHIRLELQRRVSAFGLDVDWDKSIESSRKRKVLRNDIGNKSDKLELNGFSDSGMSLDVIGVASPECIDDDCDMNHDECCICKMDGSLICCDGCPAAYHSRCVGVSKALLPEGAWHCPECLVEKRYGRREPLKFLQGAKLLGIDPHGRLFFGTCGYLLVCDSCDPAANHFYYNRTDLRLVLEALKSSDFLYDGIIHAITMHWEMSLDSAEVKGSFNLENHAFSTDLSPSSQSCEIPMVPPSSLPSSHPKALKDSSIFVSEGILERNDENEIGQMHSNTEMATPMAEESLEILKPKRLGSYIDSDIDCAVKEVDHSSGHLPENKSSEIEDFKLEAGDNIDLIDDKEKSSSVPRSVSVQKCMKDDRSSLKIKSGPNLYVKPNSYVNLYSFGHVAASVAEDLACVPSNRIKDSSSKKLSPEMEELKIFSRSFLHFQWPNIEGKMENLQQENCGWCFNCKISSDKDCLFNMANRRGFQDGKSGAIGPHRKNREQNLVSVISYILSMEHHLRGLLTGPWENPHFSKHYRKSVRKASTAGSLKHWLLTLESNMRRVALSADWYKQVDSAVTLGSAFLFSTSLLDISAKRGAGRKRGRKNLPDSQAESILKIAKRSGLHWWRGGRTSRQVFHCKALPRSLACKGGRQAGCKKLPGLVYNEGSDFAKRSKYIAWRACLEMATSVAQLGCQLRDLDQHIMWDDIVSTEVFSRSEREATKLVRPLKKVTIRSKCTEGLEIKYLLDFGKRKTVPSFVVKHGAKDEEELNGRKAKYWLDESHVPLNLLKAFEEKQLAHTHRKMKPEELPQVWQKGLKSSRENVFLRLLSKAEKYDSCQCGHCKQDVLIRKAVSCHFCKGYFHRKHAKASEVPSTDGIKYTCYGCQGKAQVRRKAKVALAEKQKISTNRCSERLAKKVKYVSLRSSKLTDQKKKRSNKPTNHKRKRSYNITDQKEKRSNKHNVRKKKGPCQSRNVTFRNSTNIVVKRTKALRTQVRRVYWLNGLLWTTKLDDIRGNDFRNRKVLLSSEDAKRFSAYPICFLCHEEYDARLIYLSCENCGDWFHGDSLGVTEENIVSLLGFKCYQCRERTAPTCPYAKEENPSYKIHDPNDKDGTQSLENSIDDVLTKRITCKRKRRVPENVMPSEPLIDEELKAETISDCCDRNGSKSETDLVPITSHAKSPSCESNLDAIMQERVASV
ncbi:hypothetical protein AMTRI_Chr01g109090 [Amborella trichopoda]